MGDVRLVGPFIVESKQLCLTCYGQLFITTFLGRGPVLTFCKPCGRRPVQCSCPPPPEHPWAKR